MLEYVSVSLIPWAHNQQMTTPYIFFRGLILYDLSNYDKQTQHSEFLI